MNWNEFFSQMWQFNRDVLGPIGGLGAIIAGFSTLIGNFWAARIIERDKAKHSQVLEEIKANYERDLEFYRTQLEISKSIIARYSEHQFETYNQLWTSLFNLRKFGDALWERANPINLQNFSNQLRTTKDMVGRMGLFIEDEHFAQLNRILFEFSEYQFGKERLIDLRSGSRINHHEIEVFLQIQENRQRLNEYSRLTDEIRDSFRRQINLSIRSPNEALVE